METCWTVWVQRQKSTDSNKKVEHEENVEEEVDLLSCTLSPNLTGLNGFSKFVVQMNRLNYFLWLNNAFKIVLKQELTLRNRWSKWSAKKYSWGTLWLPNDRSQKQSLGFVSTNIDRWNLKQSCNSQESAQLWFDRI